MANKYRYIIRLVGSQNYVFSCSQAGQVSLTEHRYKAMSFLSQQVAMRTAGRLREMSNNCYKVERE